MAIDNLPSLPIETVRLRLREFRNEDWEGLFHLYGLPETSRYERWAPLTDESKVRKMVENWVGQQGQMPRLHYGFAVELKADETFIGYCGLERGFSTEAPNDLRVGFVAYRYLPDYWNQGYATEALKAVVRWGFDSLQLHRIHSGCVRENAASARVLVKVGMHHEGTTRKSIFIKEDWYDYQIYGILRNEVL